MTRSRSFEDVLDQDLRNPAEAVGYLGACLEDGDPEVFLLALRDVARAQGGVGEPAEAADLTLRSLQPLLDALGFRLAVKPKAAS